jgi:hypothetical protein
MQFYVVSCHHHFVLECLLVVRLLILCFAHEFAILSSCYACDSFGGDCMMIFVIHHHCVLFVLSSVVVKKKRNTGTSVIIVILEKVCYQCALCLCYMLLFVLLSLSTVCVLYGRTLESYAFSHCLCKCALSPPGS